MITSADAEIAFDDLQMPLMRGKKWFNKLRVEGNFLNLIKKS